jgi:hypothetical protein
MDINCKIKQGCECSKLKACNSIMGMRCEAGDKGLQIEVCEREDDAHRSALSKRAAPIERGRKALCDCDDCDRNVRRTDCVVKRHGAVLTFIEIEAIEVAVSISSQSVERKHVIANGLYKHVLQRPQTVRGGLFQL